MADIQQQVVQSTEATQARETLSRSLFQCKPGEPLVSDRRDCFNVSSLLDDSYTLPSLQIDGLD